MILIRHGHKAYRNGDNNIYRFDPPLTSYGKEQAFITFNKLLNTSGPPTLIISSPYMRTRQTAEIAQEVIFNRLHQKIEIYYNNDLQEYLGNHKSHETKDFYPQTLEHLIPFEPEPWDIFIERVKKLGPQLELNIWYISHALVIEQVAKHYFNKIVPYPKELDVVII